MLKVEVGYFMTLERGKTYMLWDGSCGFCRRCCEIAERFDEKSTFTFIPYQSVSEEELQRVGLSQRQCSRELKVVTPSGKTLGGAFAVNYFCWQQPKLRPIVFLALIFPVLWLIEVLVYRMVATNRVLFSRILFPKA